MPLSPKRHRPAQATPPRPSAAARGYNHRWAIASKAFLRENPLCYYCGLKGVIVAATCVDHFVPHKGDEELFWDGENWRASCAPCNNSKRDLPFSEWWAQREAEENKGV